MFQVHPGRLIGFPQQFYLLNIGLPQEKLAQTSCILIWTPHLAEPQYIAKEDLLTYLQTELFSDNRELYAPI